MIGIGIAIGIPIGALAFVLGIWIRSRTIKDMCEFCGVQKTNIELFICTNCIEKFQEEQKQRVINKMWEQLRK